MVAFNQRERLLAALASTVAEDGYNKVTVARITAAASVSRRTFYENFADKEACFIAAYEALDDYLASLMAEAAERESEWPERVASTYGELIRFLASRPELARLYLVEAAAAGERMGPLRRASAERFIELLEPGRRHGEKGRELAEGMEEALVGGVMTLLARRVVAGEAEQLGELIASVVEFVLAPYLGTDPARRIGAANPA
jgi:AcrR family transcriptional regulator